LQNLFLIGTDPSEGVTLPGTAWSPLGILGNIILHSFELYLACILLVIVTHYPDFLIIVGWLPGIYEDHGLVYSLGFLSHMLHSLLTDAAQGIPSQLFELKDVILSGNLPVWKTFCVGYLGGQIIYLLIRWFFGI